MMRTKQTSGPASVVDARQASATGVSDEWPRPDVRVAALALFADAHDGMPPTGDLDAAVRLVDAAQGDRRVLTAALEVLWRREAHCPDDEVARAIRVVRLALLQSALQRAYTR